MLNQLEISDRRARRKKLDEMYKKYMISAVSISREEDVVDKIVELFERHKNENIG